jgi:hypothetical protein
VVADPELIDFMRTICAGKGDAAARALVSTPALATAHVVVGATRGSSSEFFLDGCAAYVYAGHTALHVAAAAYEVDVARALVAAGADIRARNRRGAEPLHEAVNGEPGSPRWDPSRQAAMVAYLIDAGADPDATAAGGVTPLHRAVRNRCSAAVRVLLDRGADPRRPNDAGSTAITLAGQTTGRGGTGSAEAKAEQAEIVALLSAALG